MAGESRRILGRNLDRCDRGADPAELPQLYLGDHALAGYRLDGTGAPHSRLLCADLDTKSVD